MARSKICRDDICLFFVLVLISVSYAYKLEDESFGMTANPSRWSGTDQDDEINPLDLSVSDEINVARRGFNPFRSNQRGIIPYYFYRDGINYGGRLGAASLRPWNSRTYGMNRLRPSFGVMSIRSRAAPFGYK